MKAGLGAGDSRGTAEVFALSASPHLPGQVGLVSRPGSMSTRWQEGKSPRQDEALSQGSSSNLFGVWPQARRTEGRGSAWMPRQHMFTETC